ncbi:MAG: hypothetical protein R2860_00140 [Desulfobacterales bacterium]
MYAYLFGDTNPDSLANVYDVTTDYMQKVFNRNTTNASGVTRIKAGPQK